MAERQSLIELYQATFGTTPTSSRLDQAENELDDLGGDFTQLAREWAAQDNSVQSVMRLEALEAADDGTDVELFDEEGNLDDGLSDDDVDGYLDQGVYFARVVEQMYENLFGRTAGDFEDGLGNPLILRDADDNPVDANGDRLLDTNGEPIDGDDVHEVDVSGGQITLEDDTGAVLNTSDAVLVDSVQGIFGSDSAIADLDLDELNTNQEAFFSGDIDFQGFQYWVNQLLAGALDPETLAPSMVVGAREFESDDASLMQLNQQGLSFLEPFEAGEPLDVSMPAFDYEINDVNDRYKDFSDADDDVAVIVHETPGSWFVRGAEAHETEVWIHEGLLLGDGDPIVPELSGVDRLAMRNTEEVDLRYAQDVDQLIFYDTDAFGLDNGTEIFAENVHTGSTMGLVNVDADVTVEFNNTTSSYDLTVQGFSAQQLTLENFSSAVVGTRLNVDSQTGDAARGNSFDLDAYGLNRVNVTGEEDLTLSITDEAFLTRVTAQGLNADLAVDLTETGLAEGSTLFHGVLFGSQQNSHFTLDDSDALEGYLWKDYPGSYNTFTFDGNGGHNTLTVSAENLAGFNPGAAWDDPALTQRFTVEQLHTLDIDGGNGGGTRLEDLLDDQDGPARVADVVADDAERDLAQVVADERILDTGLFGDALEEVILDDVENVHVVTRDVLPEITLNGTREVDVEAGAALEMIRLTGEVEDANIFADGDSMREVRMDRAEDVWVKADGPALEMVSLRRTDDIRIEGLGTIEVEGEDADGNPVVETEHQVVHFDGVIGSNEEVTLAARDGIDTLALSVSRSNGNADITAEGDDLDTLHITNNSTLSASLDNINLEAMNADATIAFDGTGDQWAGVTPDDQTSSLTIEGTADAWQEVRLDTDVLGGLVNGEGVTIGADATLYLGDGGTLERGLDIHGEGALRLGDGTFDVFHADPGAFQVGRDADNTLLRAINSEATIEVAADLTLLNLGYARTFSGDAARVELHGEEGDARTVNALQFADGHVRDLELYASATEQSDDGESLDAHYIGNLDTELLFSADENAGNTSSIQIMGPGDIYIGLSAFDDDDGGTHDRLAGLADDGTITAGDGEFHAVVSGADVAETHTLDMEQFGSTPDSLGFYGIHDVQLAEWQGEVGPLHFYDGFTGTLEVEVGDDLDALTIDVLGAGGALELDGALDDALHLTATDGAANLPDELLQDTGARQVEAEVDGTGTVNARNETSLQSFDVTSLTGLAHDGQINLASTDENGGAAAEQLDFAETDQNLDFRIVNEAGEDNAVEVFAPDLDADAALTIENQSEYAFYVVFDPTGTAGAMDLSDADETVNVDLTGGGIRGFDEDIDEDAGFDLLASGATGSVNLLVEDDNNWVGDVEAGSAADEVTVDIFGDDNAVGAIDATQAEEAVLAVSGNDNDIGSLSAGNAQLLAAAIAGSNNTLGVIDGEGSEGSVQISLEGDDNDLASVWAADAEVAVTLEIEGDDNSVGTLDADSAEVVTVTLDGNGNEVDTVVTSSTTDGLDLEMLGSGNVVTALETSTSDTLHVTSSGGGAGTNTVAEHDEGFLVELNVTGDTDLVLGSTAGRFSLNDGAEVNVSELAANLELWLDVEDAADATVELFGDDTADVDRTIDLAADGDTQNLEFDFDGVVDGQRVTIDMNSAGGLDLDDDLAFDFTGTFLTDDNFRVNGFGEDDADDWEAVFDLAGKAGGDTRIHKEEGDFELQLVGISAEAFSIDNFELAS